LLGSMFGSGVTQIDGREDTNYSNLYRTLTLGLVGGATYYAHKNLLNSNPAYAVGLYNAARKFEDIVPNHIGTTFGFSERASSYVLNSVSFHSSQIISNGVLTETGEHFQRIFGDKLDVASSIGEGYNFTRTESGSPFLSLEGHEGIKVRFAPAGNRFAGSSYRYNKPLGEHAFKGSFKTNFLEKIWEDFHTIRHNQSPLGNNPLRGSRGKMSTHTRVRFSPWYAKFEDTEGTIASRARTGFSNFSKAIGPQLFELFERPQTLLSEFGVGLKQGAYNKVLNVPFLGEGGLLNNILLKRVLPIAVGITAAKYIDYKTNHHISSAIINIPLKTNVFRAELTDHLPFTRKITDWYKEREGNLPQYAPIALPFGGLFIGGIAHLAKVVSGKYNITNSARVNKLIRNAGGSVLPRINVLKAAAKEETLISAAKKAWGAFGLPGKGVLLGLALMAPFVPGMIGSRDTANHLRRIYSGEEDVPVRQGRGWEVGSVPFAGTRITAWRPHESVLMKSHARIKSLYGTEENYWAHNKFLHPLKYIRDPYYLEKLHEKDRPYPITSPAFSNVPLVGPLLAATIGKILKPVVRMHTDEWQVGDNYDLYSSRLEPKGPDALHVAEPREEFSLWHAFKKEVVTMAEFIGLPGFIMKSAFNKAYPNNGKKPVYLQGSRQIDSTSKAYYEKALGAGMFLSPEIERGFTGYSEPLRRFIQHEGYDPQVNELKNDMPSWLPGEDYLVNFKKGDPYNKVDEGFARLPGAGYEALHPEVTGINPEDYSDIAKLRILGDVAPYSREYQKYAGRVKNEARNSPDLQVEYDRIASQVKQTKESTLQVAKRHFNGAIDSIEGTVTSVDDKGIKLSEYPGRVFSLSSVGTSMADLTAHILGEHNITTSQATDMARDKSKSRSQYLSKVLAKGTHIKAIVPRGAVDNSEYVSAVINADGTNVNRELINRGYATFRGDLGGAEEQGMFGTFSKLFGKYNEEMFFQGDQSVLNPLRYVPTPFHTKFAQQRTALSQYKEQESIGTRMRRWDRPIHDFLAPYIRGAISRATGADIIPKEVQHRRDLDTLTDMLKYLRNLNESITDPEHKGKYTSQSKRTNIGANLYSSDSYVASTLPTREARYFRKFVDETDPDTRNSILNVVPEETKQALQAQWIKQAQRIDQAENKTPDGPNPAAGRPYSKDDEEEYKTSGSKLGLGDYLRSRQIARFFFTKKYALPDSKDSPVYNPNIDYEDVKLKIINEEGYDAHDFNIYDDRSQLLWRKPYLDGAVRELTSGDSRSQDQIRLAIEQMMIASGNKNPDVRYSSMSSVRSRGNVSVDANLDNEQDMLTDMRRNPEDYGQ
jgi:hypothetical protein